MKKTGFSRPVSKGAFGFTKKGTPRIRREYCKGKTVSWIERQRIKSSPRDYKLEGKKIEVEERTDIDILNMRLYFYTYITTSRRVHKWSTLFRKSLREAPTIANKLTLQQLFYVLHTIQRDYLKDVHVFNFDGYDFIVKLGPYEEDPEEIPVEDKKPTSQLSEIAALGNR